MTVKSRLVFTLVQRLSDDETGIPVRDNQRIQVVNDFIELSRARKHQYAAFVRSEGLLVVWDDDPSNLIHRVESIESDLLRVVWGLSRNIEEEKTALISVTASDEELQAGEESRPTRLYWSIMSGCTLCLLTVLFGRRLQNTFIQVATLGNYSSLAFLALTPIIVLFSLVGTRSRHDNAVADRNNSSSPSSLLASSSDW